MDDINMQHIQEDKNFFVHLGPRQRKPGAARKRVIQQLVKNLPELKKKKRSIFATKNKVNKSPKKPLALADEDPVEKGVTNDTQAERPIDSASPTGRRRLIDDLVDNLPEVNDELPDYEALLAKLPKQDYFARKVPVEEDIIDKTFAKADHAGYSSHDEDGFGSRGSSAEPPALPGSSPPLRAMISRNSSFSEDSLSVMSDAYPPPLPSIPPPLASAHMHTDSFESDELNHPNFLPQRSSETVPDTLRSAYPTMSSLPHSDPTPTSNESILPLTSEGTYTTFAPPKPADHLPASSSNQIPSSLIHPQVNQTQVQPSFMHPQANQLQRRPSFDSGMDTISSSNTEHETDNVNSTLERPLQLPQTPIMKNAPMPLPKPETPLWLKKMMDWQHMEKEKELSELKKLQNRLQQLETQNEVRSSKNSYQYSNLNCNSY